MNKLKVMTLVGTRPEIIKMSPVIRVLEKNKSNFFILHTGQHYSYNMDKLFFEELELQKPKYNLDIGLNHFGHGKQTGKMLEKIEEVYIKEKPDIVLVEGDTNSVLAGTLAATKMHIKVGHIEAGLRSYDRFMPEEQNRVVVDHLSDYLFAPTKIAKNILLNEGIRKEKIFMMGNTIVDAVLQNLKLANKKLDVFEKLNLEKKGYFLITAHREENVDFKYKLKGILEGLGEIYKKFKLPIIYPIHPRTKKRIKEFNLRVYNKIKLIEPLSYLEFLQLEANSRLNITDSGGIQEESCILKVPCVTLRENTERPETLKIGCNILAGTDSNKILNCTKKILSKKIKWKNPFGDGNTAKRVVKIVLGENV